MENSIVDAIFKFRWSLSFLSLLIIIAAAAGLQHVKFDGSTGFFFGENHPNMKIWNEFSETFGSTDKAMLMLKSKDGSSLVKDQAVLTLVEQLTEEIYQQAKLKIQEIEEFGGAMTAIEPVGNKERSMRLLGVILKRLKKRKEKLLE